MNVLPLPVTPSNVCLFAPWFKLDEIFSIAAFWSPFGANSEFISEQVQSLLDEIVVLREENLKLLEENINLKTPEQQAGNGISGNKFNTDVAGMAVTNINRS